MNIKLLIFLIGVLFYPVNSFSQPPGTQGQYQSRDDFSYEISSNYEYGFNTDIDGGGKFNLNRYSIGADFKKQINQKTPILEKNIRKCSHIYLWFALHLW